MGGGLDLLSSLVPWFLNTMCSASRDWGQRGGHYVSHVVCGGARGERGEYIGAA